MVSLCLVIRFVCVVLGATGKALCILGRVLRRVLVLTLCEVLLMTSDERKHIAITIWLGANFIVWPVVLVYLVVSVI